MTGRSRESSTTLLPVSVCLPGAVPLPEIGQVQRQTSTCRIALTNYPTSRWLTAAASNGRSVLLAARSRMPSGRPTDRRHTRASGVSSGRLGAAYSSAHSPTNRPAANQPQGLRRRFHHDGRKQYRTAHSRATLAGHRPMPCYGAVNASVDPRPSSARGSGAGHPNSPPGQCVQMRQARTQASCLLAHRQAFSRARLLGRILGSYPKPLLRAVPSDSLSRAKRYRAAAHCGRLVGQPSSKPCPPCS
jgi:hypothetical protein